MAVSAAKLEANRKNALLSKGPTSECGKRISSQNAVKHGMRSDAMILRDEDPQELEACKAAWTDKYAPRDEVEQSAVDDAVKYMWMRDRARCAQAARVDVTVAEKEFAEAVATKNEVLDLSTRLFKDRTGPLTAYPTIDDERLQVDWRRQSTSHDPKEPFDPDQPAALVIGLTATLQGCEWMLGEWARLETILKEGLPWLPSDKLKAVRLLGHQPLDAIDEPDVAMVFMASFVLNGPTKNEKRRSFWEIATELNRADRARFRSHIADRQLESLLPANPEKAREALQDIIVRATERLREETDGHRRRTELKAARATDTLAMDESPFGQRLRDYELANGRGIDRALNRLEKMRRPAGVVGRQTSDVRSQRSDVGGQRSEVRRQESVVRRQESVVRGQTSEVRRRLSVVRRRPSVAQTIQPEPATLPRT
jgi:hypothetical protein